MSHDDDLRFERPPHLGISKPAPEECYGLSGSLMGNRGSTPVFMFRDCTWFLECQCCNGSGRHDSGHLNVQDAKDYPCKPCAGTGEFRIQVPK